MHSGASVRVGLGILLGILFVGLACPASAEAQRPFVLELDLTPALEDLGIAVLGAFDAGILLADLGIASAEGERRRVLVDCELVLGALQLAGAIPAWWQWTREAAPSYRAPALAAAVELTAAGALMLAVGVVGYAMGPPSADLRVSVVPCEGGVVVGVGGRG